MLLTKILIKYRTIERSKVKGWEERQTQRKHRPEGTLDGPTLPSGTADLGASGVAGGDEGRAALLEETAAVTSYASTNLASKYVRQSLAGLQGGADSRAVLPGDQRTFPR